MRLLYFTKYTRLGASSRLRSFQFFPYLESENVNITVYPLFNDEYLNRLYSRKSTWAIVLISYIKRFFRLFEVYKYDLIVIEKELFPYFPAFFEVILHKLGIVYVVDYDDAIFHNYDQSKNILIRGLLGNKIDRVMSNSNCVFAGNSYIAERAKKAGAKRVCVLHTVIDLMKYQIKKKDKQPFFLIGWIGSPTTFKYLKTLNNVFKRLNERYNIRIKIIGSNEQLDFENSINIKWTENSEVEEIQKFDIGIMPLIDNVWEKGKCSYKLIQYMGCGKPVIASPVGMNQEVVIPNFNGYLPSNDDEWYDYIEQYINDPQLVAKHGLAGRDIVEKHFNTSSNVSSMRSVFKSLIKNTENE